MVFLIIAAIVIFIVLVTYFSKLALILDFEISRESKSLSLILRIYRINVHKLSLVFNRYGKGLYTLKYYKRDKLVKTYELKDIFEKRQKKKKPVGPRDIIDLLDMFFDKRRLVIDKLSLDIDIGLEDAAATALVSGIIVAAVNIALARIYFSQGIPKTAMVNVKPYFGQLEFRLLLECILSIRVAYIMMAGIRIFLLFVRKKVSAIASDREHSQNDHGRDSQDD